MTYLLKAFVEMAPFGSIIQISRSMGLPHELSWNADLDWLKKSFTLAGCLNLLSICYKHQTRRLAGLERPQVEAFLIRSLRKNEVISIPRRTADQPWECFVPDCNYP